MTKLREFTEVATKVLPQPSLFKPAHAGKCPVYIFVDVISGCGVTKIIIIIPRTPLVLVLLQVLYNIDGQKTYKSWITQLDH